MKRKLRFDGVAGGDGIANGMNLLFNRFYGTVLLFIMVMMSGVVWGQTTYSTPGTHNWVCPADVTTIQVEAWGGGGAGGGTGTATVVKTGGGGGGGAYAKSTITVIPGNNYTITVGAGGTGISAANGNPGGNSSFASSVIAAGGSGGSFTNSATGGNGGTGGSTAASTGNTLFRGGNGGNGPGTTAGSGAGGSGGGTSANGGDATTTTAGTVTGGGAGAASRTSNGVGNIGSAPGGGGSGGYGSSGSTTARAGGAGGAGRVVITPIANTVTFNSNGGSGTMANQTASTATNLTTNSFTRTGYTFAGWNTLANGTGTAYADGASFPFTANTTLYAQWTINNYSLAYNGNTNTGGTAPATQNGDYNTSITVSNEGTLTKTGYSFTGWNTAADGSGTSYAAGATYTVPAASATLYAQWLTDAPTVDYTGSIITLLSSEYGSPSSPQSLTIIGNNLTENLTLDMGPMFEYSTDGTVYTNTLSIAPSGGAVNAPIYFRVKANTPPTATSVFGLLSSSGAIKNVNIPMVTVTPRNIFLLGVNADTKTYDGTTTAVLSGFPFLFSVVGSDSVSFTGPTTGTFNNANAGTNKTVTISDYTLTGIHADRYTLIQPSGITADIDKRTLAISDPTIAPKVYDGTTVTGTVTPGTLTGLLGSETLVVTATGAYGNADADTGKFATVAYVLADGTNGGLAANYFLAIGPGTGDITKANQTITFGTLANKTTADAPFNLTATASSGLPVTYNSSDPSVASVFGNTVTIGVSGTTFITASQEGDGNYNAAMNVQQIQLVTDGPCLSEDFNAGSRPSSWIDSGSGISYGSGYADMSVSTGTITMIAVANPSSLTFDLSRTTNATLKNLDIQVSTTNQTSGFTTVTNFNHSNTTSGGSTPCSVDLSAYSSFSTVYIRFNKTSGNTSPWRIDNVSVFCVPACTAPTTSATALTVNNATINSLDLNFTRGSGDGVLIVAKAGATPAAAPTSGTAYNVNDAIDGGVVVYKGTASGTNTATVQTIGSLLEGTQYQFSIYEYITATNCYQATALEGSGTTLYREIDVSGNSTSIVNNDATPSLTDHTDFGSTAISGGTVVRTFTIHNTGNTPLSLTDLSPYVVIGGTHAADFSLTLIPSTPIAGAGSTTFQITFDPSALGVRTATLSIANNDANENPYTFTIQGTGVNSNASDIIADSGFGYTSNINYTLFQSATIPTTADGVAAFRFTIRDGGASASDADLLGTELTGITFNVANIANIRTARLYDGTTLISAAPTIGSTIAFTGLSGTNVTAPDNGTKTLTLYVSFLTSVTDNQQLQYTVASASTNASGSSFATANAGGATSSTTGDINRIEVVADRLVFVQQPPTTTTINVAMSPAVTVSANDVNGNRDLDHATAITITSNGTLTGSPVSGTLTSGLATFNGLTHTVAQSGRMLTAASTGLIAVNSDLFDIMNIVYVNGDWITKTGGTWTGNSSGTVIWYRIVSGSPVEQAAGSFPSGTADTYTVYVDKNVTISVSSDNYATGKIHILNGGTVLYEKSGTPWTFRNIIIDNGGTLQCNTRFQVNSGGNFEIKNGGNFIYNYNANTLSASSGQFFGGTEIFHPNSNFTIKTLSGGDFLTPTLINAISTNSANAYFGNIIVDYSAGENNFTFVTSGSYTNANFQKAICNNLIFRTANSSPPRMYQATTSYIGSANPLTIQGNLNIESSFTQNISFTTTAHSSGSFYLKVNGDFVHNGNLTYYNLNSQANNSALYYLTVAGNVTLGSNAKYVFRTAQNSTASIYFQIAGNLTVSSTGEISDLGTNTSTFGNVWFNGTGTLQTVDYLNQSTNNKTYFSVRSTANVKLLGQNLALGTNSRLTIENGGTFDFGFDGINGTGTNALNVTGPEFISLAGSTLKITSGDGITSTATPLVGNVRTSTRTFASDASYEYIGITTPQATGNALPSSVRNLVINNTATNGDVRLTNDVIVTTGLTMTQGNIDAIFHSRTITLGTSASNTGTLSPTTPTGFVKGTMARWFSSATTTGNAGLFPLGTNETSSKNRHAKIDYTTAPSGGKLTASILTGTPTLVSPYLIIDGVEDCDGFLTQTVEDFNWRLTASDGLANGRFTGAFTKEGTAIGDICEVTLIRKNPTTWEAPTTNAAAQGPLTKFTVSRTELNAFGDFGIAHKDNCVGTKTWTGTQWEITPGVATTAPTITEHAVIDGDYDTSTNGALTACSCTVKTGEEVVIQSTSAITLLEGFTNDTGYEGIISIKNNATLLQLIDVKNATDNNNTGKINMERITKPMYRYDFTYWSSPVFANSDQSDDATSVLNGTEFNLKQLSPMTLFDKYYKWNHAAATPGWETIPVGVESMVPGRGYIVRAPQTPTYGTNPALPASYNTYTANFIGVPNNGIVQHAVSGPDKWNLIGNPYPSAISADRFFEANVGAANGSTNTLEGTLYIWTHNTKILETGIPHIYSYSAGDYASYNGTGSTNTKEAATDPTPGDPADNRPTGYIAAGQSFFIKGTASGEAVFNNGMRIAGDNNQFFRPAPTEPLNNWETTGKHRVWLNMKGQTVGFNQLLVGYIENATNDWDIRFDGESFGGNQVTFYSLLEDKKLSIQGRALPFNNQDQVPLGYKTTLNGTLTISIDEYDGLFEGQEIYLEDKLLNIVHDLKAVAYNFTTLSGTFNDRFVLRYLPSEQLENPDHGAVANGIILYQENEKIMIKSQFQALEQVTIYDLLGRNLFDKTGIGQNEIRIENVVMNEQPLIVKIKLANGQIVNKKIVY